MHAYRAPDLHGQHKRVPRPDLVQLRVQPCVQTLVQIPIQPLVQHRIHTTQ